MGRLVRGQLPQCADRPLRPVDHEIDAFVTDAAINEAQRAAPPPGIGLLVAEA